MASLLQREITKRPDRVRLSGRILFLTEDPDLIRRQLSGEDLPWDTRNPGNNPKLRDDISTDEITPAHYCFYFDQTLGEIPYMGLKCGNTLPIGRADVKEGGFVCSVSGKRRGKRPVRGGRSGVRSILFLVAAIVARYDKSLGAFRDRLLAKGKEKMVIRIALARKLLVRLNAKARDARAEYANAT